MERNCIRNRKIIFASGRWVLFVLFGLDEKWPDRPEPKQPQKCAIPTQKLRQFFLSMNQKEQGHSAEETDRLNSKYLCVRENDQWIWKSIFKSLHFSNYLTRYLVPYLCTINQISSLQKHSNRLIILIKPLCHFLQVTSYYQKLFLSHTRCWLCTISTYEALLLNFNPTFYIYIWIQKWILQVCIVLLSLFQSLSLMKIVSETLQKFIFSVTPYDPTSRRESRQPKKSTERNW